MKRTIDMYKIYIYALCFNFSLFCLQENCYASLNHNKMSRFLYHTTFHIIMLHQSKSFISIYFYFRIQFQESFKGSFRQFVTRRPFKGLIWFCLVYIFISHCLRKSNVRICIYYLLCLYVYYFFCYSNSAYLYKFCIMINYHFFLTTAIYNVS